MIKIMNYVYLTLIVMVLGSMASCKKADTYYYDYSYEAQVYDGTTLDYLMENRAAYDSMLLALDLVPDLRGVLAESSRELTVFAMTNRSFELAISAMNANRAISGLAPIYLEEMDRGFIDALLCRYVFQDLYDTHYLSTYEEGITLPSFKYDYPMHLNYLVTPASGFVGGGQDQIVLSDVNNSIFHRYWQSSRSNVVNIRTRNGYIHVLSQGHNFGFNKLISEYNQ